MINILSIERDELKTYLEGSNEASQEVMDVIKRTRHFGRECETRNEKKNETVERVEADTRVPFVGVRADAGDEGDEEQCMRHKTQVLNCPLTIFGYVVVQRLHLGSGQNELLIERLKL